MTAHIELLSGHHSAPIIGYHRAPLSQKFGAPRQPNLVALTSIIEMIAPYDTPLAFVGLDDFSHIWLSWQFHHNHLKQVYASSTNQSATPFRTQVRPPRLGGNQKIGVFASRSMYRPSGLGLSVVKLDSIDIVEGRVLLTISGADMIDGTPIIDIKPYIAYSDALIDANSGFAPTAPALLEVTVTESAYDQFMQVVAAERVDSDEDKEISTVATVIHNMQRQLLASDIQHIRALIAQDPRPAYRRDERETPFVMRYKSVDVSFHQKQAGQLDVTSIRNYSP